jgi:hypothetical protein
VSVWSYLCETEKDKDCSTTSLPVVQDLFHLQRLVSEGKSAVRKLLRQVLPGLRL